MVRADFLTGIGLTLISLYVLIESWRMPRLEHLQVHPLSVPGLVPAFLAVVLFVCGLILIIRSAKKGGHRLGLTRETLQKTLAEPGNQRLLLTAILAVCYAGLLIGTLPYWLATGLFVFVFIVVFEWKEGMPGAQWWRSVAVAAILAITTSGAVTWVFDRLFLVTLP